MRLTIRDRHMLQWINGHGCVTVQQAARWMDVTYPTGQRRMQKLTEAGYLQRRPFEHRGQNMNWLTKKGWDASGDSLPPPKSINRVTVFHDMMLVDLSQDVVAQTGGAFFTERRLRADLLSKGSRTRSHLPDGLLYIDDQKPIAIELEMSVKAADRLDKIIASYFTNLKLKEVWYFVTSTNVRKAVERTIGTYDGFKVINWEAASCN